ncbi:MAG: hypothetical protein O3C21_09635 [Verrucomicrobia bacterium]|nr:hypothetical protein [Verrucomicrobiota bacterium]
MKVLHLLLTTATAASVMMALVACQSPSAEVKNAALPAPTRLASIAVAAPDGTVIVLADRSTWVVDPEDRITAIKWRTADLVEAVDRPAAPGIEFPAILTNQESGTRIHASKSTDFEG